MNTDINNVLLKILEAIDYTDDREAFVKEFTDLVQIQAMDRLINPLPQEQQDSLKVELTENKDNLDKIGEILKSRFSEEQMRKSLEETTTNAVTDWMKAIDPTLSDDQKVRLANLSLELQSASLPAPTA